MMRLRLPGFIFRFSKICIILKRLNIFLAHFLWPSVTAFLFSCLFWNCYEEIKRDRKSEQFFHQNFLNVFRWRDYWENASNILKLSSNKFRNAGCQFCWFDLKLNCIAFIQNKVLKLLFSTYRRLYTAVCILFLYIQLYTTDVVVRWCCVSLLLYVVDVRRWMVLLYCCRCFDVIGVVGVGVGVTNLQTEPSKCRQSFSTDVV